MLRLVVVPVLVLLIAPSIALARDGTGVVIEDYGVYETRADKRVPHPNSATGEMNIISHLRFLRKAQTISAQLGRSFGWRYRLKGVPDNARITFRTVHPPITNPETGQTKTSSWRTITVKKPANLRYTGYTFDYSWELAEGRWSFQVLYGGKIIGERAFNIVIPLN